MTLSRHVVTGARCVRGATLALTCTILVGAAALQVFDLRYGHSTSPPLRLGEPATGLGAELAQQEAVTRWMPDLMR